MQKSVPVGTPPSWYVDLIRHIFLPYDAEAILHIPLSERAPVDKRYWHEAKRWEILCLEWILTADDKNLEYQA